MTMAPSLIARLQDRPHPDRVFKEVTVTLHEIRRLWKIRLGVLVGRMRTERLAVRGETRLSDHDFGGGVKQVCLVQVELDSDRFSQMIKVLPVYPRNQISGTGLEVDQRF